MSVRSVRAVLGSAGFRLRMYWRGALAVIVLGILALGLVAPIRSLARTEAEQGPALSLPEIPSPGPALIWTDGASPPAETQRRSLGGLLALLSGLAWIGFGVAAVSIFSSFAASARERARDTGVHRAAGASLRQTLLSLGVETAALTLIALGPGLLLGAGLIFVARRAWPGPSSAVLASDPATLLALGCVIGLAGLASLRRVSARDLIDPPDQEVSLKVPAYQVAMSVALLMGAASLLGGAPGDDPAAALPLESAEMFQVDSGAGDASLRAARYASLLDAVAHLPGTEVVSLTSAGAVLGLGTSDQVTTECGRCYFGLIQIRWPNFTALAHAVSSDSFRAHGIRITSGRGFEPADTSGARRVAVVNHNLAMRYFERGEALGRAIYLGRGWPKTPYTVIGVVEDRRSPLIGGADQPRETVYLSLLQHPPAKAELIISSRGPDLVPSVRRLGLPGELTSLGTVAGHRDSQLRATRWIGAALAVSAILVLAMALLGTLATARIWAESIAWELALRRGVGATRRRMAGFVLIRTAGVWIMGGVLGIFFYGVVVAPALARAMPGIPGAEPGHLLRVAVLPLLLALLAAITPGLLRLTRPPAAILR
ncbi:MAG TPA: FtsX-like permease family protein [Gemmatimonadales bacterium]|nr:FtsX-like permease family protein [Gemmatimonadales bacterium]